MMELQQFDRDELVEAGVKNHTVLKLAEMVNKLRAEELRCHHKKSEKIVRSLDMLLKQCNGQDEAHALLVELARQITDANQHLRKLQAELDHKRHRLSGEEFRLFQQTADAEMEKLQAPHVAQTFLDERLGDDSKTHSVALKTIH